MRLVSTLLAAAAAAAVSAPASAATIVNLDGRANASLDGSNAVPVVLAPGSYRVTFVDDLFTAFNRFGRSTGCDSAGENCSRGFMNGALYSIDGMTFGFGDANGRGSVGPVSPGNGYYTDAATSFANSGQYSSTFQVSGNNPVNFYLFDDALSDNVGGVSLSIAAVPEPATWAFLLLGFGAIGGAMRSSRRRTLATA